jgi:hypothetical protein
MKKLVFCLGCAFLLTLLTQAGNIQADEATDEALAEQFHQFNQILCRAAQP